MKLTSCFGCDVSAVVYDSRKAGEGSLFVCLRGASTDGHRFAKAAYDNGCRDFAVEYLVSLPEDARQYRFDDTRAALADISAEFFGYPASRLHLIGVTGTKGKTSTAYYLRAVLNQAGHRCGMIGTLGVFFGEGECREATVNSTPESYELHRIFAEMVNDGCEYCVMEVSSQAYKCRRVHGLTFDYGVFTNLSPDHIGPAEHADFEEYRACKAELFAHSRMSVLNADDEAYDFMRKAAGGKVMDYSQKATAYYRSRNLQPWRDETGMGSTFSCIGGRFRLPSPGEYSVYNALAAITVAREIGITWKDLAQALGSAVVPGRFEIVPAKDGVLAVIDYAHNELSLRSILTALRPCTEGRLIVVFGSVGGKAEIRRGGLGRAAAELADYAVITSDNPDFESPEAIIADIEKGIGDAPHTCIADRGEAIAFALDMAESGDTLLFAGKGHEDYQIINGEHIPFSERALIAAYAAGAKKD